MLYIIMGWTLVVYIEVVELRSQVDGKERNTFLPILLTLAMFLLGLIEGVVGFFE